MFFLIRCSGQMFTKEKCNHTFSVIIIQLNKMSNKIYNRSQYEVDSRLRVWGVRSRLIGTLLNVVADPVCVENTLAHCIHLSVFSHSIVDVHVLQSGQYQFSKHIYFCDFSSIS